MTMRPRTPSATGRVPLALRCALGLPALLTVSLAVSQGGGGVSGGRCLICHVDIVEQLEAGRHGGKGARLSCETCHGESEGHVRDEHNQVKPDRTFASETKEALAALVDLCARCHQREAGDYREVLAQVRKREPALPSCTGCHGSHRVARLRIRHALASASAEQTATDAQTGGDPFVVYDGFEGPGHGKHIVFVTGDEEYRSEESMPQLAKILAVRHGFRCTVLFAINRETGEIDPQTVDNIPGLEALAAADLMVLFTRFRELPDEQMKRIIDYTNSGRPIVALRTATHAFNYVKGPQSPYATWSFRATGEHEGGYGRQVLGETWIDHYGRHQQESTRGLIAEGMEGHPIVRGCEDIWGPSDVYAITRLSGDSRPLVMGQVLAGMEPDDPPNPDKPPVPVAWTKTYTGTGGKTSRVFTTTMGHGGDLRSEGFRRLLVNACYWALGMEDAIPERSSVDLVGEYDPNPIGFGGHKRGLRPRDHALAG
jgi:Trehalose utilisation